MDMPTPEGMIPTRDVSNRETLARIAQVLGCSVECFFEPSDAVYSKDAARLIQTWLAIRSPKARNAVFAFACEMLRADKGKSTRAAG
ncbi:hypothetical protein [Methylobacterium sp. J-068]|uniref:hypothetical protein n=1 Tax=Methylobacterium sp. J-068 TaxID=2836649 RepID=UPI001FB9225D|nr:hypothetical protein [Methylobacterium sp. J-068]MCJ2035967.1 hypothetical protein [Methylobacterium sp. J-068]